MSSLILSYTLKWKPVTWPYIQVSATCTCTCTWLNHNSHTYVYVTQPCIQYMYAYHTAIHICTCHYTDLDVKSENHPVHAYIHVGATVYPLLTGCCDQRGRASCPAGGQWQDLPEHQYPEPCPAQPATHKTLGHTNCIHTLSSSMYMVCTCDCGQLAIASRW